MDSDAYTTKSLVAELAQTLAFFLKNPSRCDHCLSFHRDKTFVSYQTDRERMISVRPRINACE